VPAFAERVHVVEALQRVRIASKKELFSVGFTLKSSENIKAQIGKWVLGTGGDSNFLHPTVPILRKPRHLIQLIKGNLQPSRLFQGISKIGVKRRKTEPNAEILYSEHRFPVLCMRRGHCLLQTIVN
jgi:hypothetical protein